MFTLKSSTGWACFCKGKGSPSGKSCDFWNHRGNLQVILGHSALNEIYWYVVLGGSSFQYYYGSWIHISLKAEFFRPSFHYYVSDIHNCCYQKSLKRPIHVEHYFIFLPWDHIFLARSLHPP